MSWLTAMTSELAVPCSRQLIECRQFLDARRAPACPQVDQRGFAIERLELRLLAGGIVEIRSRSGRPPMAPIDTLARRFGRSCGALIRKRLGGLVAGGKRDERAADQDETHRGRASLSARGRLVGSNEALAQILILVEAYAHRRLRPCRPTSNLPPGQVASGQAARWLERRLRPNSCWQFRPTRSPTASTS